MSPCAAKASNTHLNVFVLLHSHVVGATTPIALLLQIEACPSTQDLAHGGRSRTRYAAHLRRCELARADRPEKGRSYWMDA
jgi:hypothetical protein